MATIDLHRPPHLRCLLLIAGLAAAPLAAGEAELIGPAGKCLGIRGAPAERAPVVLETCADNAADQRWQLPSPGFDGPIVGAGGLCLDVANAASDDHTPLQVFACHDGANQRWRLQDDGRLVGLAGKCADIEGGGTADGTPAVLFGCHGGENQRFRAAARNAWSRLPVPSAQPVYGAIFAGEDGRIVHLDSLYGPMRSADGGRSWSVVTSERSWSRNRNLALVDRTAPDRLFATASEGLLFSQDGGRTWVVAVAQGKFVRQSAADGNHFFALTHEALFRSVDRGVTFQRLASLPADGLNSSALAVARDGDLYLSRHGRCNYHCSYDSKLYRSGDLGATWTFLRDNSFYPGEALLPHPTAAGTLYWLHGVGIESTLLVERSDDDGATWTTTEIAEGADVATATTDPGAPDDLWLIGSMQVLRSRDRGASWQTETFHPDPQMFPRSLALSGGRILVLATKPGNDDLAEGTALLAVHDAAGWVALPPTRFGAQAILHVAAAAQEGRFYASQYALWRTDDSGRSWAKVQERACPESMAADPQLPDVLYLGNVSCGIDPQQSVVYRSTDGGATLEPVGPSRSGATRQIRAFPWQGGTAVVALSQPFTFDQPAVVVRSLDRFQTWSMVELPGAAYELLYDQNGVLFAANRYTHSLYRSFDAGQTWTTTVGAPYAHFAAGGGLLLAVGLEAGALQLSNDAGGHWRPIPAPFAWGVTQAAEIDPQGRIVLVDGDGRMVASSDEGRSWQWLAHDQPATYTRDVAFDPYDARRMVVATDHGPYLVHSAPAAATPAPLALGERFEARLSWRDRSGNSGEGHGARLTDDTGLFWLFTPERAEVAVKLLDARAINGRFWVFVASLTHVELDLEIFDRLTGERRTYHNPLGQPTSFGDTIAFPLGAATLSAAQPPARPLGRAEADPLVEIAGRFLVVVDWTDSAGQSGDGQGFRLSQDTAAFYFFSPSNVELLVNIVDGRPLNGHHWVFFGGLSNVAYRVTITDTLTGQQRTYENPAGTFASFADTSAF